MYASYELYDEYRIRRWFPRTSHRFVAERAAEMPDVR